MSPGYPFEMAFNISTRHPGRPAPNVDAQISVRFAYAPRQHSTVLACMCQEYWLEIFFKSIVLLTSVTLLRSPCPSGLGRRSFPSAGLLIVVVGAVLSPEVHCQVVSDVRRVRAFIEYILIDAFASVSAPDFRAGVEGDGHGG